MTSQLNLIRLPALRVSSREVLQFCARLQGKGWQTSTQLGAKTEREKRHLRLIAELSDGAIVSYPGSPGYKLFDECEPEDFRHGRYATRAQIRKMFEKWRKIERRMHRVGVVMKPIPKETATV
jgi:hypothetical protein